MISVVWVKVRHPYTGGRAHGHVYFSYKVSMSWFMIRGALMLNIHNNLDKER